MHLKNVASLALYAASAAASPSAAGSPKKGCDILLKEYPSSTFFPGSQRYDFENEYGWSTSSWLGPACIFTPETPEMVSFAVRTVSRNKIKFAIRGGGAMPMDNAANIGSEGILIANTNLTAMEISNDHGVVSVGAGIKWPELYSFLDQYKVTANGIRIGDVGVIGFLLGGGIGFFSYEHGIAATGVESFECVLGNGNIVEASLTKNPDLFWALRGGGNNFCFVTCANIRTLDVPTIRAAAVSYGTEVRSRYIQSAVEFALYADADPKASMEGQIRWDPRRNSEWFFDAFLFHGDNDPSPPGLQNFTAPVLEPIRGNLTETSMGVWANQFPYSTDRGNRKIFHFFSIPADTRAMEICLDTYSEMIQPLAVDVDDFFTAFSIMPITRHVIEKSVTNGGSPVGLDENSAPALWLVESPSWVNAADDTIVLEAHERANAKIDEALAAEGFKRLPFVYLSDASKAQLDDIFPSYGLENVRKLQSIRNKYDPASIFTNLQPGGAKVAHVEL